MTASLVVLSSISYKSPTIPIFEKLISYVGDWKSFSAIAFAYKKNCIRRVEKSSGILLMGTRTTSDRGNLGVKILKFTVVNSKR